MTGSRFNAKAIALSILLAGPLQASVLPAPWVQAQQMGSSEVQPAADRAGRRSFDGYDVGATAANVVWVPFKAGTCGISAGVGALAFVLTLGAARAWSESALHEGCVANWLLTGANFRPLPSSAE